MRLVIAGALVATLARAQDTAVVRACDRPSNARVQAALYGHLATIPKVALADVGPGYMQDVLEAVRESWRPGPLGLGVYSVGKGHATLTGATTVMFSLAHDGALSDLGLASSSLSAELDRAVYSAVQRADSAKLFVPVPEHGPGRVRFYLTVYIDEYPDTATTHPGLSGFVAPLFTTALPGWDGDVSDAGPTTSHPEYPETARVRNAEDSLLVRFVIDERGHPVPSSIWFEAGTYQEFAKSIERWLPHAQYSPGHIGKCAVKVLASQVFKYSLTH